MQEFLRTALHNADLLTVGVAIIAILILGALVFLNNRKSITNETFLMLALAASLWSVANYLNYKVQSPILTLWFLRSVLFFAIWYCFSLFQLFYVFPEEEVVFGPRYRKYLIPVVILTSITTLTPFVFESLKQVGSGGDVSVVHPGPGMALFGIVAIGLIASGITILAKKIRKEKGPRRVSMSLILIGAIITFSLHIAFNFLLPAIFEVVKFIPYGALFTFPFIAFTAYAIFKYKLFNVKVVATELITFALWIFILLRTLLASSSQEQIINGVLLGVTIIVGLLLIRSVLREVEQREKLQKLTIALENANEKLKGLDKLKTEFLSLASHQLRSPLTAIKGYASMLLEGSFKEIQIPEQKTAIDRIFQSSQNLARVVEDLLDVSKIEQGGMKYEMSAVDMKKLAKDIADELKISAKNKGLELSFEEKDLGTYVAKADPVKIRQAVLNLVDNSIKYTAKGFIKVIATKPAPGKLRISITDSGMGISEENKGKLFEKFSRGDGGKVNAGGSGLGLYLVKEIVEAHGGKVWAESPGVGQGSSFIIELPEVADSMQASM